MERLHQIALASTLPSSVIGRNVIVAAALAGSDYDAPMKQVLLVNGSLAPPPGNREDGERRGDAASPIAVFGQGTWDAGPPARPRLEGTSRERTGASDACKAANATFAASVKRSSVAHPTHSSFNSRM